MINDHKYKHLSTFELIKNVAQHSDKSSLNEIISSRKLFTIGSRRCILPEYLKELRKRDFYSLIPISVSELDKDEKLNLTHDRSLMKFSNLGPEIMTREGKGPYCNKQYEALFKWLAKLKSEGQIINNLEDENIIGKIFKNMVIRHIGFEWLEACRELDRYNGRYRWRISLTETFELKEPQRLERNEFRKWLEENVVDRLQENILKGGKSKQQLREEIQKKVDDNFGKLSDKRIDDANTKIDIISPTVDPLDNMNKEYLRKNFFKMIALEKSKNSRLLRPTIRELGEAKIYQLVLRILSSGGFGDSNDSEIAEEFRLSKATYSRFAGIDWKKGDILEVPDLWRNIAKVVTSDPIFKEVAIENELIGVINLILKTKED